MVNFADFVTNRVAVCRKLHEKSSVGQYYSCISDWNSNDNYCYQFYDRCAKIYAGIKVIEQLEIIVWRGNVKQIN